MIPDRLGYFLDDFGNFENLVKNWTRRPTNYYRNASQIQENMGTSWTNIIVVNLGLKKLKFSKMYVLGTRFSRFVCEKLSTYF